MLAKPPDIFIAVYDSVRPDWLPLYGAANRPVMPNLSAVRADGVLVREAITAAPWTLPSVGALLSGTYAHKLGLFHWQQPWPAAHPNLFRLLVEQGYSCRSIVFDETHMFSAMPEAGVIGNSRTLAGVERELNGSARPLALFFHSWLTHIPWRRHDSAQGWRDDVRFLQNLLRNDPPRGEAECKARYGQAIAAMDEEIGELRRLMQRSGRYDDSMLVLMSDHGEYFCERTADRSTITDNFALHGRYMYEELLRIMMLLKLPGNRCAGSELPAARSIDILPTVLAEAGIQPPAMLDGSPLFGGASPHPAQTAGAVIATCDSSHNKVVAEITTLALRRWPWKLVHDRRSGTSTLSDLRRPDPDAPCAEGIQTETYAALRTEMEARLQECTRGDGYSADEEEAIARRLADLGYL